MKKFQKLSLPILLFVLAASLNFGCSAKIKKSRALHRAEEYFKNGDYDKAKIEYTNALRIDPKDPELFLKIASMWLEEGVPLRAGPFLIRGKELAPQRADIPAKLAEVYIAVSGLAEARKEAAAALEIDPQNEDALLIMSDAARSPEEIEQAEAALKKAGAKDSEKYHLALATLGLRKNDMAKMEAELQHVIALNPKSSVAHLGLARYRLALNNREAAANEFKLAADSAPPRSTAHLMYAEFKAQSGAADEAIAHLNEVLKKAPDYLPGWTLLAKITAPKSLDQAVALLDNVFRRDNQNFDARMLEADSYLVKGDGKKAVDALKALESNYQKIPIVKLELARAYLQNGDAQSALATVNQALTLAPTYGDAILLQAETNLRLGNAAGAASSMEDFLKNNPANERAEVMLADAYRALNRFEDAAAILRKQIQAKPQDGQAYLMLGVLLRQQGKNVEARQNFEKAFELSQNKLAPVNQLIEMDIEANDYAAAMQRIKEPLEKYPEAPALHLLAGKIYFYQNDWDKAEAELTKVLQLNANIPGTYDLLVSVYIRANKLPQAVTQLEAFLAKSPDNIGTLMTLALVHSEMKQFEKARDTYEKLLAIRSDNAAAANNLAYIYADQLNQLDKARDWAAKARSGDPTSAAIADTFGWILYRQGDYRQAAGPLKEAAEKMPNEPEVQYHAAMVNYMMGDTKTARIEFEAAALSQKDFPGKDEAKKRLALIQEGGSANDASAEQLESLLKQQPNDPVALARLAELYDRQGAPDKAAGYYEQAIKANPSLPGPIIKLAQLYAGPLQKKDRALELAKKARDLAPADARSTSIVGRLAFQAGNYSWAYSVLQESARQLNEPGVLKDFAWAAYSLSKIAEARQAMEKILANAPDSAEAKEAKTFLTLTAPEAIDGKVPIDESEVEQKLKEDDSYAPALLLRGNKQIAAGDKTGAVSTFSKILKQFPDFAPAQKQLAALYLENPAQRSQAYDLANSARKTLTDDPELAAILGEASFYKKDYTRTVQLLQDSNKKKALDARHLYFLGMALIETKHAPEGRECLTRAISGGLPEEFAANAAKAVKPPEEKKQ